MKSKKMMKILTIIGTILLFVPFVFMVLTSIVGSIIRQKFLMDYLITMELFPVILIGSLMIVVVSFMAKINKKRSIALTSLLCLSLIAPQAIAVVTGIASGDTPPQGAMWLLILFLVLMYNVILTAVCVNAVRIYNKIKISS